MFIRLKLELNSLTNPKLLYTIWGGGLNEDTKLQVKHSTEFNIWPNRNGMHLMKIRLFKSLIEFFQQEPSL